MSLLRTCMRKNPVRKGIPLTGRHILCGLSAEYMWLIVISGIEKVTWRGQINPPPYGLYIFLVIWNVWYKKSWLNNIFKKPEAGHFNIQYSRGVLSLVARVYNQLRKRVGFPSYFEGCTNPYKKLNNFLFFFTIFWCFIFNFFSQETKTTNLNCHWKTSMGIHVDPCKWKIITSKLQFMRNIQTDRQIDR